MATRPPASAAANRSPSAASNSAQCGHCGSQKTSNCTGASHDPTSTPSPSNVRGTSACAVPVVNITITSIAANKPR